MTSTRPADILRQLDSGGPDDRTLASRYASHNDQAAFAELVRRHGPMVWAACLRIAGNRQDAEDAFQAVFLVLVRKLGAIRNLDLLGNWLYGVAVRVAMKARRSAARRRAREVQVPTMPDPPDLRALTPPGSPDPDLAAVLDEELSGLPSHYREALVLCDLRGVSRTEAATLLGIPEGTLSSRLANGRKKLAERLARRGVVLSAAMVPGVLADAARAAVPVELVAKVQHLATGAAVPAAVARLASGGFSVKTTLLMGMMCAAAVAGAVYAATPADPPRANDPPKPPVVAANRPEPPPEQKTVPDPKAEGKVAFTTNPKLDFTTDVRVKYPTDAAWSPDGRSLIVVGPETGVEGKGGSGRVAVILGELTNPDRRKHTRQEYALDASATIARFLPDSRRIITDVREYHLLSGRHELRPLEHDSGFVGGIKPLPRVSLESGETHGYHFSADGKTFRTVAFERDGGGAPTKIDVREVDAATGKTLRSLMKLDHAPYELSPDGRRLAVFDKDGSGTIYDVGTAKKLSAFKLPESPLLALQPPKKGGFPKDRPPRPEDSPILYRSFSPDGRLLVVARGIGAAVVLKTDTGEALPALEGTELAFLVPGRNAFSGDGRLLVLGGQRYVMKKSPVAPGGVEQTSITAVSTFLTVWDTQTGKPLKSWDRSATAAFNPVRPLLAILEPNGDETRVGLWDFAADVEKK